MSWKQRVMKHSLTLWEPATLEPRTGDCESGSSGDWHSPVSGDSKNVAYHGTKGMERPALLGQVRADWPTPQSMDGERGAESRATKQARGAGGVNLREACNWTTPQSRDWKGESQRGDAAPGDCLPNQVLYGQPDQASLSTTGKRHDWSTPEACQAAGGHRSRGGKRANEPLLTGQAPRGSGSLNPQWVLQLMGFPADWLDGVEPPCKLSATALPVVALEDQGAVVADRGSSRCRMSDFALPLARPLRSRAHGGRG